MLEVYTMNDRKELHAKLLEICDNVYYQPPENIRISYPCIIYTRGADDVMHADDFTYKVAKRYDVTVIEKHPDPTIPEVMRDRLRYLEITSRYVTDNLYHTKIKLYY